ncbi:MAG TPA: DMT family transporter [Thermoplasmatales archaeon]|nr:DMT family transporter [Thermoplasmatales archaeon]
MNTKQAGILFVLLASMMWAVEPVFAKLSYQNSDFLQTSGVRAVFVTLTALVYVVLSKRRKKLRVKKKVLPSLIYLAVVGTVFADLLYFFALTNVPVVNAVLIGHMQPVFVILIGFFILKTDKLTAFDYIGIAFMITSGLLVTTKTLENLSTLRLGTSGDLMVLVATIAWATTTVTARRYLKGLDAGIITFYRFMFASIVLIIYLTLTSNLAVANYYQMLVGVVVGVGTILYYEGLKRIKAAQVSAMELTAPFFAALFGFFILGETVTVLQLIGISLLLMGIYCLSRKEEL